MPRSSVPHFTLYGLLLLILTFWWAHPPEAHQGSGEMDRTVQPTDGGDPVPEKVAAAEAITKAGSTDARDKSSPPTIERTISTREQATSRTRHHPEDILAALTIFLEAEGESFEGKLAVAAVIRNRMRERYQSDGTVQGTVLRSWQFEPWVYRDPASVDFDLDDPYMRDSLLAWLLVQDGREVVDGALLFLNPRLVQTPAWARISRKVASIGRHEFFKPPKAAI